MNFALTAKLGGYSPYDGSPIKMCEITLLPGYFHSVVIDNNRNRNRNVLRSESIGFELGESKYLNFFVDGEIVDYKILENHFGLIGYIPNNPTLLFSGIKSDVRGELELAFQFRNVTLCAENMDKIDRCAAIFELTHLLERDPFTLSGGEASRLACALVLLNNPRLLILEAFYENLDPSSILHIRSRIADMLDENAIVLEVFPKVPFWINEQNSDLSIRVEGSACKQFQSKISKMISLETTNSLLTCELGSLRNNFSVNSNALMSVEEVGHQYDGKNWALKQVAFEVFANECIALMGPNGSGKSTLFKSLARIIKPTTGKISISSVVNSKRETPDDDNLHLWSKHVLHCFQNPLDQFYKKDVGDELKETAKNLNSFDANEFEFLIEHFQFKPLLNYSPYELSSSEQRMLSIASAILARPSVLLIDEPTVGLDCFQLDLIMEIFLHYLNNHRAIMFISHDIEFCHRMATRVIDIRKLQE